MNGRATMAAALLAATWVCGVGCGDETPSGSSGGTTTAPVTTVVSSSSSTSTTVVRGEGTRLTADDAVLVAPSGGKPVTVDPGDPCAALASRGTCAAARRLAWVTSAAGAEDRSPVTVYAVEGGAATPVLVVESESRAEYGSVRVVPADLDGRPGDELIVGLRNAGTGGLLQLDVVDGDGRVVAHVTLDRGRAEVDGPVLRTWAARYLPDDPNCCPSEFAQAVVIGDGGTWRSVPERQVPAEDVPPGDYPEVD